ncbi:phosphatidylserine/phosphatidylglycerophosphate/cardiolipin synthase family protein [Chlamydia muridarum str. Nigg]|uniref:phospholipase D n=2 Tax=Chlamydia muridarum TaxID=83560 RepID=A0A070A0W1_CHLMR|nr:phosphatidylserine/phosphatidylglycerophosphate/cardiolipin synthase family protein [Chlamydia muridarum]AAF39218.1 phospholipase D family protein [Chlamydia muridarum str. Nigg]AHH22746.1 phospholipase [Chlamydia muridarum str. Nigg3 CMUT3-5]AHH23671.1 phospholipase [Chlamydia muridarum str. Nigg CM972]AID37886.1 phospholipase [Chlamydia muridarum str. Nigg 2 MCR]AIT90554.1 phospholipase [Chlamydia muridarum]
MKKTKQLISKITFSLISLFIGGYLLKAPPPNQSSDTFQTFIESNEPIIFSKQCGDNITQVLCDAINSAKKDIFLSIYDLSSSAIISELKKQEESQIPLCIHYQRISKSTNFSPSPQLTLVEHPPVKNKLMHQKTMAIDGKTAWIASANLTFTSLEKSANLVIGLKSPELCHFIKTQTSGICCINNQPIEYFSLNEGNSAALEKVLQHIRSAKESIQIGMFALTLPQIIKELNNAQNRGVDVVILVDKGFKSLTLKQIQQLEHPSLSIYEKVTPYQLHHKFGIFDKKTLITGSVNWSEKGFFLNTEDMIVIENLTEKQQCKIQAIWDGLIEECTLYYSPDQQEQNPIIIPFPTNNENQAA